MADRKEPAIHHVKAVHGAREITPDPDFELGLTEYLRSQYDRDGLVAIYARFAQGESGLDMIMRRAIWRAVTRGFGHSVRIGSGVGFQHLETFDIGNGVFIGAQAYVQGRYDGTCTIGDYVWLGPQSYLDARDLIIESHVAWGPGAKLLGSAHTGIPMDVPIIETDLEIKPVRVEAWADVGTNAVVLPGVTIGKGSIIGAGAVVVHDVPPFAVVAGIPARFLRWRDGYDPTGGEKSE